MTRPTLTAPAGFELCDEEFGSGDAASPPIVLISGAGLQMLMGHEDLCGMLADLGYRAIRFDHRDAWPAIVGAIGDLLRGEAAS